MIEATIARRFLTIGGVWLAAGLATCLAPLLLPLALIGDVVGRRRLAASRFFLFLLLVLTAESLGAAIALVIGADTRRNYALQRAWAGAIWAGATRIYGVQMAIEGDPLPTRGPLLLLARHATVADTLLPIILLGLPAHLRPRYVLKRELLWDPCLDVVGNRIPNLFVRRVRGEGGSSDDAQLQAMRALAAGMGAEDFAIIYPEGTRFTPEKREKLLHSEKPAIRARAERLRWLLPPRPNGVQSLLDGAPEADVLWCAHTGMDAAAGLADFWAGGLIGAEIRVRFWLDPRAGVPIPHDERLEWLQARWERMDRWMAESTRRSPSAK